MYRIASAGLAAVITFAVVFAAIFVPMLFDDMHVAPHDGQGGMGGFFLGFPIAILAAIGAGVYNYSRSSKRKS